MIKDKYDWVKKKLTLYPELRDSNERLYYHYLTQINYDINKPLKEFLKDMEERKVPYIDALGRTSRKVQEEHPHLRGKTWKQRKTKADEVKKEVKTL